MNETLSQAIKLLPVAKALIALANPPESDPLQELKALIERAGARHNMSDNEMIQRAHDLLVELGAMCGGGLEAKGALILRHPGHTNQKVHGNRYGGYAATKESLRRLKGDKEARERYKQSARNNPGRNFSSGDIVEPRDDSGLGLGHSFRGKVIRKEGNDLIVKPVAARPGSFADNEFRMPADRAVKIETGTKVTAKFKKQLGDDKPSQQMLDLQGKISKQQGKNFNREEVERIAAAIHSMSGPNQSVLASVSEAAVNYGNMRALRDEASGKGAAKVNPALYKRAREILAVTGKA